MKAIVPLTIFLNILATSGIAQTIRLDSVQGMIPESRLRNLRHRILVWNDYQRPVTILFSNGKKSRDTIAIANQNGVEYVSPSKYARIYSGPDHYIEYLLEENAAYIAFWDRNRRNWLIQLYKKIDND